jgi:uncharacterized protein
VFDFDLSKHIGTYILVGQLGSKAYGTDTPESDNDYTAVAVAPLSHYIGLDKWENDGTLKIDKKDTINAEMIAFEIQKFLKLCLNFNPNVIPLLYLRDEDYEIRTYGGHRLIEIRDAFTSKRAYKTMIGYAESQRKAVVNLETGKLGMKRKELVKKFGYDVKYASHTIRILRMAIEFFRYGKLNVYRTYDKDELKFIRAGNWSLNRWVSEVDHLLETARKMEQLKDLPENPQFDRVNMVCMDLINAFALR